MTPLVLEATPARARVVSTHLGLLATDRLLASLLGIDEPPTPVVKLKQASFVMVVHNVIETVRGAEHDDPVRIASGATLNALDLEAQPLGLTRPVFDLVTLDRVTRARMMRGQDVVDVTQHECAVPRAHQLLGSGRQPLARYAGAAAVVKGPS